MHFPLIVGCHAQFIGLYEGHRKQITDHLNNSDWLSSVSPDKDVIAVTVEGLKTQQATFRSQITNIRGVSARVTRQVTGQSGWNIHSSTRCH